MGLFDRVLNRPAPVQTTGTPGDVVVSGSLGTSPVFELAGPNMRGTYLPVADVPDAVWQNPTGYRAVQALAANESRPPIRCGRPGQPPLDSGPLVRFLDRPAPRMSPSRWVGEIARDRSLYGRYCAVFTDPNGQVIIGRTEADGGGLSQQPAGLRRLNPARVLVLADENDVIVGFRYTDRRGRRFYFLPSEVFFHVAPHHSRPDGWAPARSAVLGAQTDDQASRFNLAVLLNDGSPGGLLIVPGLTAAQFAEAKSMWDEQDDGPGATRFLGSTRDGQTPTYVKTASSNKDMTYSELRELSQDDVLRAFGVPRAVAADPSGETFANADAARAIFWQQVIVPALAHLADDLTVQVAAHFGDGLTVWFDLSEIEELAEAKDALAERHVRYVEAGVLTRNEVRAELGLPEYGTAGAPAGPDLPASAPSPGAVSGTAAAERVSRMATLACRAAERVAAAHVTDVERRSARGQRPPDPDYWQGRLTDATQEAFAQVADLVLLDASDFDRADPVVRAAVEQVRTQVPGLPGPDSGALFADAVHLAHTAAVAALNALESS